MPEPNQRRYIRHPSCVPVEIQDQGRRRGARRSLRNIGKGGLCFHTPNELEVGHAVSIRFPSLPHSQRVQGTVAWCRAGDGGFDVGVRFQDADDVHSVRMYEQVFQIEQYRARAISEGRTLSIDEAAMEWISRNAGNFGL